MKKEDKMLLLYATNILLMISLFIDNYTFIVIAVSIWVIVILRKMSYMIIESDLDLSIVGTFLTKRGKQLLRERKYANGIICVIAYPMTLLMLMQVSLMLILLWHVIL